MFKELWFSYGTACIFYVAASRTAPCTVGTKTVAKNLNRTHIKSLLDSPASNKVHYQQISFHSVLNSKFSRQLINLLI